MDVVTIRLPEERERLAELRLAGRPRLLLVPPGEPPPEVDDVLEDWVRLPASEEDVDARARALQRRVRDPVPVLDGDGVLHRDGRRAVLPPIEARLAAELLDRSGSVVTRDALMRAGWPDGAGTRNLLDVRILRLRRRLAEVGLVVRTVRHRGYLLEVDPSVSDGRKLSDSDA